MKPSGRYVDGQPVMIPTSGDACRVLDETTGEWSRGLILGLRHEEAWLSTDVGDYWVPLEDLVLVGFAWQPMAQEEPQGW